MDIVVDCAMTASVQLAPCTMTNAAAAAVAAQLRIRALVRRITTHCAEANTHSGT